VEDVGPPRVIEVCGDGGCRTTGGPDFFDHIAGYMVTASDAKSDQDPPDEPGPFVELPERTILAREDDRRSIGCAAVRSKLSTMVTIP